LAAFDEADPCLRSVHMAGEVCAGHSQLFPATAERRRKWGAHDK
jgi:hypothetical protein